MHLNGFSRSLGLRCPRPHVAPRCCNRCTNKGVFVRLERHGDGERTSITTGRDVGINRLMTAPNERTVRLAVKLLERTAGRRRRCRRCGHAIVENAGKRGAAWSICAPCAQAIEGDARQAEIASPHPPVPHVPRAARRPSPWCAHMRTCVPGPALAYSPPIGIPP